VAGLAVAEEGIGQTIQNLKTYATLCKMQWIGEVTILAKNPHDAENIEGLGLRLKSLAQEIMA